MPGRNFMGFWVYPLFSQGASGCCTIVQRILCSVLQREGRLPRVLVLLLDNTCKENKNNGVVKYLAWLLSSGVFDEVRVFFLLVGHTHSVIDQRFSVISRAVHGRDAPTLPALMELVRGLDMGKYPVPNEYFEVRQSQDWSWLLASNVSYRFQGFNTKKINGVKHAIHAIRLSLTPHGEVVFQYKEHDRPGPWLGHYLSDDALPVFKPPPATHPPGDAWPEMPSEAKVLPRSRITDLGEVKAKVDALLIKGPAGVSAEDEEEDLDEADSTRRVARRIIGTKLQGAKTWWDKFIAEEERFWQDRGEDTSAAQEVDANDSVLHSWLPLRTDGRPFRQDSQSDEGKLAARKALECFDDLDVQFPVPDDLHLHADAKWVGRPEVRGETPILSAPFDPMVDLEEGMVVMICLEDAVLDRGWEVGLVTSVDTTTNEVGDPAGKIFSGTYLRPKVPGRYGDTNGFTPEDWPPNWPSLPLVHFRQTQLPDARRCNRLWRFVDLDVEHVIIGVTPSGRSARSTWRLKKGDQDTFYRVVVEATRKQQSQPQGEVAQALRAAVGDIAEEVEEAE